jgi:phosphatidylinositol alpha-1,6-mannosyltransferase
VVVGDGPQRRDLEEQAMALGISGRVRFVGAVAHARTKEFYHAAELVLLPNREEAGEADGLPLVFLEANACGKPVIGGIAGGTPEIVRDGENGALVDGRDPAAILAAISALLDNPERRLAMGQRGLEMAQQWSWASRAEAFLQLCRT